MDPSSTLPYQCPPMLPPSLPPKHPFSTHVLIRLPVKECWWGGRPPACCLPTNIFYRYLSEGRFVCGEQSSAPLHKQTFSPTNSCKRSCSRAERRSRAPPSNNFFYNTLVGDGEGEKRPKAFSPSPSATKVNLGLCVGGRPSACCLRHTTLNSM